MHSVRTHLDNIDCTIAHIRPLLVDGMRFTNPIETHDVIWYQIVNLLLHRWCSEFQTYINMLSSNLPSKCAQLKCLYMGCTGNRIGMLAVGVFASHFSNVNFSGRWSGTVSEGEHTLAMFTFADKLGNSIELVRFGHCSTCWNLWSRFS